MTAEPVEFRVLLIDDEPVEHVTVNRILSALTDRPFLVEHVEKCSQAVALLQNQTFDLVLLDNRLSERMSAKFSVPIIKSAIGQSPLAIISNDISPDYLRDPKTIGVDFIVDKSDLIEFLKSVLDMLLGRSGSAPKPA